MAPPDQELLEAERPGLPAEPSSDPHAEGYVLGTVDAAEIDATLAPYGEWTYVEDDGRVWRPDATVVGVRARRAAAAATAAEPGVARARA